MVAFVLEDYGCKALHEENAKERFAHLMKLKEIYD